MRVSVMRIRFNPRSQVGCDYDRLVSPAPDECFNPRTHVGCDRIFSKCLNIILQKYIICE